MKLLILLIIMTKALMGDYSLVHSKSEKLKIHTIMKSKGYKFKIDTVEGRYDETFYSKGIINQSGCTYLEDTVSVRSINEGLQSVYISVGASQICGSYYITEL